MNFVRELQLSLKKQGFLSYFDGLYWTPLWVLKEEMKILDELKEGTNWSK